jgi:hypothetical protein
MPVTKRIVGTGITQREVVKISGRAGEVWEHIVRAVQEENRLESDLEFNISEIEEQAMTVLKAAGLPTSGAFDRNPDGTFRKVSAEEDYAEGDKEPEPGVTLYDGSPFMDAVRVADEKGFDCDSPEGYAVRLLKMIASVRLFLGLARDPSYSTQNRGHWADRAAIKAMRLGAMHEQEKIKSAWEQHALRGRKLILSAGRPPKEARDIALAHEFLRLRDVIRAKGGIASDSFIKVLVGKEAEPRLKRSAAIAAVDRGLQILSGE